MSDAWIRWAPDREGVTTATPGELLGSGARPRHEVLGHALGDGSEGLLHRYRAGTAALLRARFTAPRSASLAERAWNLLCHLSGHGVGVPEPLAVGAAGHGLVARGSFLLTRAPRGAPLADWRAAERPDGERERGERALALALDRLRAAAVVLPRASAENVWIVAGDCGRLPGVVFGDVTGGGIVSSADPRRFDAQRARLGAEARG